MSSRPYPRARSAVPAPRDPCRAARTLCSGAAEGQRPATGVIRLLGTDGSSLNDVTRRGGRYIDDGDVVVGQNRVRNGHAESGEVRGVLPGVNQVSLLPARHVEHETL